MPAVAFLIALLLGACSSKAHSPRRPTPPPSSSQESRPSDTADIASIREVELAWHQASSRLSEHPNPDDSALARYLADPLLGEIETTLRQRAQSGLIGQPARPSRASFRIVNVAAAGSRATVRACEVNDGVLIRRATGQVVDDRVDTIAITDSAKKTNGRWRLTSESRITSEGIVRCVFR
jgi:hypothetical protein